jgi:hypothetical protein
MATIAELAVVRRIRVNPLLAQTAEMALDLLEKNGVLLPFCRLTDRSHAPVVITPDGSGDEAERSVRTELLRRLDRKEVTGFAACSDAEVKFAHEPAAKRCLRIELQDGTTDSGVYYFPLTLQHGRASLGQHLVADVPTQLL